MYLNTYTYKTHVYFKSFNTLLYELLGIANNGDYNVCGNAEYVIKQKQKEEFVIVS